ncbi:Na+/H+ antiporter NhaA [Stackebrandtia nassauensis]|uniref:Na(+)/H(+) antiporter NhaA n=1 Tax=Stackebrandtia nassauensis (strain DSM 44728 / CIP 108903 / NRRL B-16338 / NBRC 102104 / LLR-40K-21) TaxID=446470 RepID=D3Q8Y2_STANL|nr:Na+/H+ antiporter NhaA [Stackebrandtia nassauensis]ADD40591.1 Na+/H+ antiporter NhaA [Stackebrandtia nassauensis DSM 44728]
MARKLVRKVAAVPAEVVRYLRVEATGGLILLVATAAALILANLSVTAEGYRRLTETTVGPEALHLNLTLGAWANDGLLAIFFLVAGLELKRELVSGELSSPRKAMLPLFAAVGGMAVPALVAFGVAFDAPGGGEVWPVPTATDIAFALAVLAVVASNLPSGVRVFLLSLAVVDDLGAITLIAVLYTDGIKLVPLAVSLACVAAYWLLQSRGIRFLPLYIVLGFIAWMTMHEAGVHATIAGVLLAFATRVKPRAGEKHAPALRLEHALQPLSAGVCVPVFAFFAAGISLEEDAMGAFLADRAALAVVAGLVIGKFIGVYGGSRLAVWLGAARLPSGLLWRDIAAVAFLTGCGFTVSLLMAELAFSDPAQQANVKAAVLIGSLLAALIAATVLRIRVKRRAET